MPLSSHVYVSKVADGSDTTLVRPADWNTLHVADGLLLQINRTTIASTSTLTLPRQTRLMLTDNIAGVDHVISGVPRQPFINQVVPDGYDHDVIGTLALAGPKRMSILGTGQLVMSDDFKTRQRIVLAG